MEDDTNSKGAEEAMTVGDWNTLFSLCEQEYYRGYTDSGNDARWQALMNKCHHRSAMLSAGYVVP